MRYIIIFMVFLIPLKKTCAQANDTEAALYNVCFGGITGAIGAVINKKPDQKLGKVLVKGFWQGAFGGYVTFESKRILRVAGQNGDWKLYWSSNLVNAAGNSIKENAANNRAFWEQWNFNIGFNRLEFNTKDNFSIRYKVMPIQAAYTVGAFFRYRFDPRNSIKSGHFVFTQNKPNANYSASASPGYFVFNTPIMNISEFSYDQISAHEIIHLYQTGDFLGFNSFYGKRFNNLFKKSNFMQKINKHIYYDLHQIPRTMFYGFEHFTKKEYYKNYFEHEAGYYSNTLLFQHFILIILKQSISCKINL